MNEELHRRGSRNTSRRVGGESVQQNCTPFLSSGVLIKIFRALAFVYLCICICKCICICICSKTILLGWRFALDWWQSYIFESSCIVG